MLEPDKHNPGDDAEDQTEQEFVNAMPCKSNARPEDHWDHGYERVADRGTEQAKGRCCKGSEGDVKRELDPASEESGQEKRRRYDEEAPHEERLRVVEKEPPECGN